MKTWVTTGMAMGVATAAWAQAAAPAAVPAPRWKTTVAAGASLASGNSETLLLNGSVVSAYKHEKNEGRMGVEANYGEAQTTQGTGAEATTKTDANVNNSRAFGEYRRLVTERVYVYGMTELLSDDIADIDYRWTVGPGVGRYFPISDSQKLSADIGATYIMDKMAGTSDNTAALRLAQRYDLKLSATASLWETAEYLPALGDFSKYLINAEVGVDAAIDTKLSLRVVCRGKVNSEPAPDKVKNDLTLIAGIIYKL